ncbi:MAG: class A beta-lactamase-related serine hydrolase [Gemmatimonadales bacterium]|nr:MAG: class A beta-lactamase-related serine hydrolase [Gemmatimonadales bacterium]
MQPRFLPSSLGRVAAVFPTPILALVVATLTVPGTFPQHAAGQGITAEQVEAVDAVFEAWSDPAGPGAAVAVTRNGRVVYSQGYGSAQLEYRIPVTPTTPFHVASVSKQFTTFAVALLARDGLLSWDDEVHRHLPELPDLGRPVTLRQLGQHTSGVRDQWELLIQAGWRIDDVITRDQIMGLMLRQRELNFEPGSEYLYSNMGYSLLAEVVERVSGQEFGEFLRERVFLPLGMHRTHVHSDHTRIVPGRAYSYAPNAGGGWRNAVLSYANQGATSLFTTVEDLGRWMAEMEAPMVGDAALWAEMAEPARLNGGDTAPYGLGLSVGSYRGLRTMGHGGADAGFRTNLLFFPEEGMGVVVFGNASSFNAGRLAREVAQVFLDDRMEPVEAPADNAASAGSEEDPEETEEPTTLPAEVLAQYEGSFYSPELDVVYRVRVEGDDLVVERPRQPEQTLSVVERDRFRSSQWGMNSVEFVRNGEDEVAEMLVSGGRVRNVRFHRVEPWGF